MRLHHVRYHPVYGEPLHKIRVAKPQLWTMVVCFLFVGACIAGYFHQGPETFSTFEKWFLNIFSIFVVVISVFPLFIDRDDIRLVIYQNGVWSYQQILGVPNKFIPWSDIDYFTKQTLSSGRITTHYIVLHLFDENKYNANISGFAKLFVWPQPSNLKSYQFIAVNRVYDIEQDTLFDLLNRELNQWRKNNVSEGYEMEGT